MILVPTTFDSILRFALQKRTDLYVYFEKEIILERGGEREREGERERGREGGRRQLFVRETRKVTF